MANKDTAGEPQGVETAPAAATAPDLHMGELQAELAACTAAIEAKDAEITRLQGELVVALANTGRKAKAVKADAAVPIDATPDARVFASGSGAAGADFETETPMLMDEALWKMTQAGHCYILFGNKHHAFAELSPVRTNPEHWHKLGARTQFAGTITLTGSNLQPGGLTVSHFALALQPEGPVVALCEIPGGASIAAGREFAFGKGNILFG